MSQSSLSVVFDRTGKLVGENGSNAQIRTLLDEQRQMIIAEYCEKIVQHELQVAHAEEERRILREELSFPNQPSPNPIQAVIDRVNLRTQNVFWWRKEKRPVHKRLMVNVCKKDLVLQIEQGNL